MPASADIPLLTFAIAALNQERFIREAVSAAFAQTYPRLEIILSDDCSQDHTFDIMREMAQAYRGPHRVILNQNPARKCIGGHINRIMEISQGELVVGAAGDDVSLPQRTQVCYEAWEWSGRKATSVHSNFIQIDEDGATIEQVYKSQGADGGEQFVEQRPRPLDYVQTLEPCVFGCAHAFSRQLFRVFGDLPDHIIHEDNALALRSSMIGRMAYVKEPLVKYRLHGNNVFVRSKQRVVDRGSLERQEEQVMRGFRNREIMYEGFLLDLEEASRKALIGADELDRARAEARRMRRRFGLQRQFLDSGLLREYRILGELQRDGMDKTELKFLSRRLLPRDWLIRFRLARGYFGDARNRHA